MTDEAPPPRRTQREAPTPHRIQHHRAARVGEAPRRRAAARGDEAPRRRRAAHDDEAPHAAAMKERTASRRASPRCATAAPPPPHRRKSHTHMKAGDGRRVVATRRRQWRWAHARTRRTTRTHAAARAPHARTASLAARAHTRTRASCASCVQSTQTKHRTRAPKNKHAQKQQNKQKWDHAGTCEGSHGNSQRAPPVPPPCTPPPLPHFWSAAPRTRETRASTCAARAVAPGQQRRCARTGRARAARVRVRDRAARC